MKLFIHHSDRYGSSKFIKDNLKIENEAEHNGESTSGEVSPISKGDKFKVTKKTMKNATKRQCGRTVTIKKFQTQDLIIAF